MSVSILGIVALWYYVLKVSIVSQDPFKITGPVYHIFDESKKYQLLAIATGLILSVNVYVVVLCILAVEEGVDLQGYQFLDYIFPLLVIRKVVVLILCIRGMQGLKLDNQSDISDLQKKSNQRFVSCILALMMSDSLAIGICVFVLYAPF